MGKLIVTADIHGSKNAWLTITQKLTQNDCLAIAGDLFDTVYGSAGDRDFNPGYIKQGLESLPCPLHYVYGNCDQKDYVPGFDTQTSFQFDGLSYILNHGHLRLPDLTGYDVVIEGHSHVPRLESLMGKVFLNPGSPTYPRIDIETYATVENRIISILSFKTHRVLTQLDLKDI